MARIRSPRAPVPVVSGVGVRWRPRGSRRGPVNGPARLGPSRGGLAGSLAGGNGGEARSLGRGRPARDRGAVVGAHRIRSMDDGGRACFHRRRRSCRPGAGSAGRRPGRGRRPPGLNWPPVHRVPRGGVPDHSNRGGGPTDCRSRRGPVRIVPGLQSPHHRRGLPAPLIRRDIPRGPLAPPAAPRRRWGVFMDRSARHNAHRQTYAARGSTGSSGTDRPTLGPLIGRRRWHRIRGPVGIGPHVVAGSIRCRSVANPVAAGRVSEVYARTRARVKRTGPGPRSAAAVPESTPPRGRSRLTKALYTHSDFCVKSGWG